MLSDSPLGLRGLVVLSEFYARSFSCMPETLAHEFGYRVRVGYFRAKFSAVTDFSSRIIETAHVYAPLKRFLVYHELAHIELLRADESYLKMAAKPGLALDVTAQEIEVWCDGFATLMSFGYHDTRIINPENAVKFLAEGTYMIGETQTFQKKLDLFQGKRILRLAKKRFPKGRLARSELMALGNDLVNHSRETSDAS